MKTLSRFSFLAATVALLLAGCENLSTAGSSPEMSLAATRSSILVNESATVLVKSENTLGTHPKIEWSTNFGKIKPVKEGMLDFRADKPSAVFSSDKPGEAVVTATLTLDNGKTLSDSVHIQVNPLH